MKRAHEAIGGYRPSALAPERRTPFWAKHVRTAYVEELTREVEKRTRDGTILELPPRQPRPKRTVYKRKAAK